MHITFQRIRYKNILSTGNVWADINLCDTKTTLIVGRNGAGKSTILDALHFALYNKPFRKINKGQLLNSINERELVVELYFSIGPKQYLVRRGIKPDIFEIWVDGEQRDSTAKSVDTQRFLEQEILRINSKSFSQIVVLGSASFVPFMRIDTKNRRELIEDILDLQVFSTMNVLLKTRVSENTTALTDTKNEVTLLQSQIAMIKKNNKAIESANNERITVLKRQIGEQVSIAEKYLKQISKYGNTISSLSERLVDKDTLLERKQILSDRIRDTQRQISVFGNDYAFYQEHDDCPKCKQSITTNHRVNTLSTLKETIQRLEVNVVEWQKDLSGVDAQLADIRQVEEQISTMKQKSQELTQDVALIKRTCHMVKSEIDSIKKSTRQQQDFSQLLVDLDVATKRANELSAEREVLSVAGILLKDTGVKATIIKQYIPVINRMVNEFLERMGFFVRFELDENFDETIKSRHRDTFSYASFSEGEKLRIDLSLLFSWREISRMRNSVSTNLLIMDEILDSSLDSIGTDEFLDIIRDLTTDTNTFIISHKGEQLYDRFDRILKFEKKRGFSILKMENN